MALYRAKDGKIGCVLNSSLDSLSNVWDRPIRSMACRVNGTSVDCMGRLIHSTANQSTRERARISDCKIRLMITEGLELRIFGSVCESHMVMENRSGNLKIVWSDEDNPVGRPKS